MQRVEPKKSEEGISGDRVLSFGIWFERFPVSVTAVASSCDARPQHVAQTPTSPWRQKHLTTDTSQCRAWTRRTLAPLRARAVAPKSPEDTRI